MRVLQKSHATVLQVKVPRSKLAHIYTYHLFETLVLEMF